ncbi:hypothetical protein OSG_eHP32_00015 [environmental Halophage eHP-32]|nr:hypothetical protein OSG_eHP32_00015 [environmental Halophage eHP-32]
MPAQSPFDSDGSVSAALTIDTDGLQSIVSDAVERLRAELAGWDADSNVERAGQYRVGIDGCDVDDSIIDAVCESVADREDLDVTADELFVTSIHIEAGEPSYVEVFVDN